MNEYPNGNCKWQKEKSIYLRELEMIDEVTEFVCDAISCWRKMQPIAPIIDQKAKYRAFLQLIAVPNFRPNLNSHVSELHAALLSNPTIDLNF